MTQDEEYIIAFRQLKILRNRKFEIEQEIKEIEKILEPLSNYKAGKLKALADGEPNYDNI